MSINWSERNVCARQHLSTLAVCRSVFCRASASVVSVVSVVSGRLIPFLRAFYTRECKGRLPAFALGSFESHLSRRFLTCPASATPPPTPQLYNRELGKKPISPHRFHFPFDRSESPAASLSGGVTTRCAAKSGTLFASRTHLLCFTIKT